VLNKIHPVIKRALYVFTVVVIASVVTVALSDSFVDDAYQNEQSEKRAMRIWKNKIDGSRESNKIIDEYESSYTSLVNRHIVGEENRLSWFETIQSTANAKGMLLVKYDITSQELVPDTTGQHSAKGLEVYRSKMTLDIRMAHEGDLFAMLNTLDEKAKGLFIVDKCEIKKIETRLNEDRERMRSLCELSWYTFKSANDKG
jgi:hypothetical protein